MESLHTKDVDMLFEAILSLKNKEECYLFFEDVCTVKELLEMAQRLRGARLLSDGANYVEIAKATGMSTATISRINRCLSYGNGGYKTVLERLEDKE